MSLGENPEKSARLSPMEEVWTLAAVSIPTIIAIAFLMPKRIVRRREFEESSTVEEVTSGTMGGEDV